MPIYEYRCKKCGHTFDHLARTFADIARKCPKCGAAEPAKQFSTFSTSISGNGRLPCSPGRCRSETCPMGTCEL